MVLLLVDGCSIFVFLDYIVLFYSKIFFVVWGVVCYCSRFLFWSCIYLIYSMYNWVFLDKFGWGNRYLYNNCKECFYNSGMESLVFEEICKEGYFWLI